ncbi:acyltransferase [Phenylobacterium sp.]|uniref:acyltransferase family protein n=1 Tax=Phenylobacterium sp. TaxID=1871053 RepID=UPI002733777B|nr:acyltransferase [Phenylobacterium sp.]MDP3660175.1 acyltransferase [Phenylobacterium sp.]
MSEAERNGFPQTMGGLTSLRFWLSLGVVIFHYTLLQPWRDDAASGLIERARLGVDVFFILSGFVLFHVYGEAAMAGRLDYRRFLVARIARIYPAHLLILAGMAVMAGAAVAVGAGFDHELYDVSGFLRTLLLIHAWFPADKPVEWNGPSWSLSAEWAAYLAFPLFAALAGALKRRPWVLLGVAVASFLVIDQAYRAWSGGALTHAEFNVGVARIAPEFLYGIALYQLGRRWAPTGTQAGAAALASGGGLLLLMHLHADERVLIGVAGLLVLSLALCAKAGVEAPGWLARPLREGGEASYALYLLHIPLLVAWKNGMSVLHGIDSHYLLAPWELAVLIPTAVAGALAIHFLIERPARLWIRGRIGEPAALVA